MPKTQQRDVTFAIGKTGSGKSFWMDQYSLTRPRVLVASRGFPDFSCPSVPDYQSLVSYLEQNDAFQTFRPFRIAYHFKVEEAHLIFETAKELGNLLLVVEEAHRYDLRQFPLYEELVLEGRHYGVELGCISPAMVDVGTDYRRQITRIVSFRQDFPPDVDRLGQHVGREWAEAVSKLSGPPDDPPHPYLLWTQHGAMIVPAGKFLYEVPRKQVTGP